MPRRVKVFTVVLLWTTIGLSMWLATQDVLIRVILVLVAVGVTIHIILIKNYDKKKERFKKSNIDWKPGILLFPRNK